jgi:hypothetical protein
MKKIIIKSTFTLAFCLLILACLSCTTDGYEVPSLIIGLISGLYMGLVIIANRGTWIFN